MFRTLGRLGTIVVTAAAAACVDGLSPTAPDFSESVPLQAATVFSGNPTAEEIDALRLAKVTALDTGRDSVLKLERIGLDPDTDEWVLSISIDVSSGRTIPVQLQIELLSVDTVGAEVVQWSGESSILQVSPGLRLLVAQAVRPIEVYRGPVDNLSSTSVALTAPDQLVFGHTATLTSEITDGGPGATAFYESLDPGVARVDARSGLIQTVDTGTVRMVSWVGPVSDTATFVVVAPTVVDDPVAVAAISRAVDYYGSADFVGGMQDEEGVHEIALALRTLSLEMADGDALAAAKAYLAAIAALDGYAEGSPEIRLQDGPQLSLIDFSLIFVGDALGVPLR